MSSARAASPKATHTPGPWALSGWDPGHLTYSIAAGRIIVALVPNACSIGEVLSGKEPAIQMANVRLIEAAPDMLAKLKELAGDCAECRGSGLKRREHGDPAMIDCTDCADIRAVIDQAEGR